MASNEPPRDPRLSKNDPRLNKKRLASQSPAAGGQPQQKNSKPAANGNAMGWDLRRLSIDNVTPSSSRRGSAQSNGAAANVNTNNSNLTTPAVHGGPSPAAPSSTFPPPGMAPRTQTAPVANMGNGTSSNKDSVLATLPAQPTLFDLFKASADIAGKLSFARVERDRATPGLDKARLGYQNMTVHFENFPAIKEQKTVELRLAQEKYDNANDLAVLLEQESTQVEQMMATMAAANPYLGAFFDMPSAKSTQQAEDSEVQQQLDTLKQQLDTLKQQLDTAKQQMASMQKAKTFEDPTVQVKNVKDDLAALKLEVNKVKEDQSAQGGRKKSAEDQKFGDINAKLAEISKKVTKLESEGGNKSNPLGLVQFTPVLPPEQEPDEQELSRMQQMWGDIQALQDATDSLQSRFDNLTTDELYHGIVNVLSQQYLDAKNCQATVDGVRASITQVNQRLSEVATKVEEHGIFVAEGKNIFTNIDERVKDIGNNVAKLQGVRAERVVGGEK